jgi:hypothetical protein
MEKPKRPPIPPATKRKVKAKNLGVCCVCKERGLGINLHHIDGNPSNNIEENIAVLCVKEHDQYHRPKAYDKAKHIELGAEKIKAYKNEWEKTVLECQSKNPKVIAVVNSYGTYESIHSVRFFLQNSNGKIIYERIYHLLTGTPDQWTDNIIEEVEWLGKNVKLSLIDKPLEIEYCPCCSKSLANVLDNNVVVHLTASDWKEKSISSIYINPAFPSLALTIFYKDELVFTAHLHKCKGYLHFRCDNFEERTPIKKSTSIRTQATEIISKVISSWETQNIFIGTGDPDKPNLINDFNLPKIWENS